MDNFNERLDRLKKSISDGAKSMVNDVIGKMNHLVRGFNDNIKLDIPGVKPVSFNIPQIPKLAAGGIIEQPTLAMVGERGREAMMPLENNTGWIDQLAAKIAAAVNAGGGSSGGGDVPIEIPLYIDGDKLGTIVIKSINKVQQKAGKVMLIT